VEVSGQLHTLATLLLGKDLLVLIAKQAGWVALTLWQREKSLAPAGNQTPVIWHVAHFYTEKASL
jgi:hypothetical protein